MPLSLTTITNSNLILHSSLTLFLTLLLPFLHLPSLLLHGLHTYIHPDDVTPPTPTPNGPKVAIRRPSDTTPFDPKPRKKSPKDKFQFDENKAQIFRLKLTHNHLQSRLHFDHFHGAFNFTLVASSSFLLQKLLPLPQNSSGVLPNGTLIPILLGFVGVCRVFFLIARVSFEKSAYKASEKQLSFLIGCFGSLIGGLIVLEIIPNWVLDFGFESLDGYAKFCIAILMGSLAGFLYIPASKKARAFWLGTDQIRCNLSIINSGLLGRMLLYITYILSVFTSLLWINPFGDLFVNINIGIEKGSKKFHNFGQKDHLFRNVGMSRSDFDTFRLLCLCVTGVLQMLALRVNLQMFLNEAVLSWYQRLHGSKFPDLDYSRAKVFLHNHYLCLAAIQFFTAPALVLLFLGLSRIDDSVLDHFPALCSLIPCTGLVKEMALFMAWWVVFVSGVFVSVNLGLYRRGFLYVS